MKPLVVFDLDGTLFDAERCYETALAAVGLSRLDAGFLEARRHVKARLGAKHPSSRNRLLYFKALAEASGHWSSAEVLDLMTRYESALSAAVRAQFLDGVRTDYLKGLAQRADLAILTNENTRTQLLKLREIDPRGEIFPLVVTSEEIGCEKPDPRGFEFIQAKFGTPSEHCWMVGDSLVDDIAPARALGWKVILSMEYAPHERKENAPAGYAVIQTLLDLPL